MYHIHGNAMSDFKYGIHFEILSFQVIISYDF